MSEKPQNHSPASDGPQTRRALLAAALGGAAAALTGLVARVAPTRAAAGDTVILGAVNDAGAATTYLRATNAGVVQRTVQYGAGTALWAEAPSGTGLYAQTAGANSFAQRTANVAAGGGTGGAIRASGGSNLGVRALTDGPNSDAIHASHDGGTGNGAAIRATGGNNTGVDASSSYIAVNGVSSGFVGYAVYGTSQQSGVGVRGDSAGGAGVEGWSNGGHGVAGHSGSGYGAYGTSPVAGVWGESTSGWGAVGASSTNHGVYGSSTSGNGVYGDTLTGYAGYFQGRVHVNGTLSKSAGSFRIDHPLDPGGKYLSHSFVESPEMKNVYDGVAVLDRAGRAVVGLPSYFESLNRDLRYQLTPLGSFSPVYIHDEVSQGRFSIAGGLPGQRISWQVIGCRRDAYAEAHPIVVEEEKVGAERGTFLHPELYDEPPERRVA